MNIDFAKRRLVMARSQRLGHCICDVRRACPCDVLREQNLCPCAGERPEPKPVSQVRLMDYVRNAGCASKIPPAELDAVLARLPAVRDPAVISGLAAADDAAIYRLTDSLCLVQTVDVFTPCVDDARTFGKICAANCLSDIYAMGGEPRTALSVLAFPIEKLPGEIVYQMLAGAMEIFAEAGVALVGGHSVKDDEIKLGFAITGVIDTAVASALEKPSAGDVLVLTKPLGTGVLAFARQIGREFPEGSAAAEHSMCALNRAAAEAMRECGASACTDVTGFGLFAHLWRMLRRTGLGAEIHTLPALPGALDALRQGVIPGAIERNREYIGAHLVVEVAQAPRLCVPAADTDEAMLNLGLDAQTSGGLLIAIPPTRLEALRQSLARRGAEAFVIGRIIADAAGKIFVKAEENLPAPPENFMNPTPNPDHPANPADAHHEGCCADVFKTETAQGVQGSAAETQRAFAAFLRAMQSEGVLSAKAKQLILFSLVVNSRCQPCFDAHYRRARELGITQAEMDEAAWCAIALGGAPVKLFYQESLERLK